eukprot:TRINITY_DN10730_c0_g1_i1.p2 TRINITY_DN10730_c0_g1~~TRINITY_DN10730_c0_g1_i1.p2  ORF type:complete len:106 (+),score=4.16 TRINITY_DN10730_c0_g1_i1:552-869(+)
MQEHPSKLTSYCDLDMQNRQPSGSLINVVVLRTCKTCQPFRATKLSINIQPDMQVQQPSGSNQSNLDMQEEQSLRYSTNLYNSEHARKATFQSNKNHDFSPDMQI